MLQYTTRFPSRNEEFITQSCWERCQKSPSTVRPLWDAHTEENCLIQGHVAFQEQLNSNDLSMQKYKGMLPLPKWWQSTGQFQFLGTPTGSAKAGWPHGELRDCIGAVSLQILLPPSSMVLISRTLPKNCPSHLIFISEFFPGETNLSQLLPGVVQESGC